MGNRLPICEKMAAVRSRGLANARELNAEVERLGDWREHVRAHPVPIALAAAALGYWVVPTKPKVAKHVPASPAQAVATERVADVVDKQSTRSGIAGLALGFATTLLGNAVRTYISQQVQSLVQGKDDHASFVQRQASANRH